MSERNSFVDAYPPDMISHVSPEREAYIKFSEGSLWKVVENEEGLFVFDIIEDKEALVFNMVLEQPKSKKDSRISFFSALNVLCFPNGTSWKITEDDSSYHVSQVITTENPSGSKSLCLKPLFSQPK